MAKSREKHKITSVGKMTGISFPTDMVAKYGIKKGTLVTMEFNDAEKKLVVTFVQEVAKPEETKTE